MITTSAGDTPSTRTNTKELRLFQRAVSTYNQHDGAPAGDYAVTVFWPGPKGLTQAEDEGDEEQRGEQKNLLPAEYGSKDTTPLRFTVKAGDNPPSDFDIK